MPAIDCNGNELKYGQVVKVIKAQTAEQLAVLLADDVGAQKIVVKQGAAGIVSWIAQGPKNPFHVEVYIRGVGTFEDTVFIHTKHLQGRNFTLEGFLPELVANMQAKLEARTL